MSDESRCMWCQELFPKAAVVKHMVNECEVRRVMSARFPMHVPVQYPGEFWDHLAEARAEVRRNAKAAGQ